MAERLVLRPMNKRAKLAIVLLVVAAGGALAFAGAAPQAMRTASDLAQSPDDFSGTTVQLKAAVRAGSVERGNGTFAFVVEDDASALRVEWASAKPLPEHEAGGSIEGRVVVLTGALARDDAGWVFRATDMQVGCASKYEPAGEQP